MRILRQTTSYEFDSENAAQNFINDIASKLQYESMTKHTIEKKEKKSKGEVIATAFVATTQIDYNKVFDDIGSNKEEE